MRQHPQAMTQTMPQTMGDRTWQPYHAPHLRAERLRTFAKVITLAALMGAATICLAVLASKAAANTSATLAQAEQMRGW